MSTSSSDTKGQLSFAPVESISPPTFGGQPLSFSAIHGRPWKHTSNLELLRLQSKSPVETITPSSDIPVPPLKQEVELEQPQLQTLSTKQNSSTPSFPRFFGSKSDKSSSKSDKSSGKSDKSSGKSDKISVMSGKADGDSLKQRKKEEKLRKKEESRARMERLALELKLRSQKTTDGASMHSARSDERRMRLAAWEEEGSMWGGMNGVTL